MEELPQHEIMEETALNAARALFTINILSEIRAGAAQEVVSHWKAHTELPRFNCLDNTCSFEQKMKRSFAGAMPQFPLYDSLKKFFSSIIKQYQFSL